MIRSSRLCARGLAALALGALCGAALAGGRPDKVLAELQQAHRQHVPDEVLVQFDARASAALRQRALARVGGRPLERLRGELHRIGLPAGAELADALRSLHADAAVDFAEPNWLYQANKVPDDPYYLDGSLWGMYGDSSPLFQNAFGSQAGEAWDAGHFSCKGVMVGVIDEGAMAKHEDLKANFWRNLHEIAGNGLDDDDNGFIDDTRGWDFDGNDKSTYDGPQDDHGTHVSGTIGAVGGNGLGVAGICWKLQLLNVKFLGAGGGSTANAIKSIDYLTDLKLRHGLNLVATNNSWGGGGYSQALKDSIDTAGAAEILFVTAAGGGGLDIDATPVYPASYVSANLIAVTAIDAAGALAGNWGAVSVDLGAPGVGIWSTVPGGYAPYSGSSMAVPHVTGAIALYAKLHPGLDAAQLKTAILARTAATTSLAGKTVTGGRLDVSGY